MDNGFRFEFWVGVGGGKKGETQASAAAMAGQRRASLVIAWSCAASDAKKLWSVRASL